MCPRLRSLGLHIGDKANVSKAEGAWDYTSAISPMCPRLKEPGKDAQGGLAQLARALAWHARGHRFDPDILHLSGITHFIVCIISAEIFDILTHKTVVLDIYNNQEHSRKYETSVIRLNRFRCLTDDSTKKKQVRAHGGCLGSRRR